MTDPDTIRLPLPIARDLSFSGGTAHALRVLLVAESMRFEGEVSVTVPLRDMLGHVGGTLVSLKKAIANLEDLRIRQGDDWWCPVVCDPDEPEPDTLAYDRDDDDYVPLDEDDDDDAPRPPVVPHRPDPRLTVVVTRRRRIDADARPRRKTTPGFVTVSFSEEWLEIRRHAHVEIPADEIRALSTRCGLFLRLRAAALTAIDPGPHRVRIEGVSMLQQYSATDDAASPAAYWRSYLKPGLADVAAVCPSVVVRADGPEAGERLRSLVLTVRVRRRRSRVPKEVAA